ncbi:MAG: HEAT repeat domain-containing protein [Elusimicrobiota bacterium]|nr:HEAT repeat domain-containing protein [Elusimicrobiota bacterium]
MTKVFQAISMASLFFGVGHAAEPSATEVLARLDAAKTAPQLVAAIDAVKKLGPGAMPTLEAYAFDASKEPRVRMVVLRKVIAARSGNHASNTLQDLIGSSSDENFRALCAEELGRKPSPGGRALLKKLLFDSKESAHVQLAAAMGLAEMGDDAGKDRAKNAVLQNEPWANLAVRVLEKLKAKDVIAQIDQQARNAPDAHDRGSARIASLKLQLVDKSPVDRLGILEEALRDKESREVRKWAAMRLADIGSLEAGERLASVVNSGDSALADTAMRGLRMGIERKAWTKEKVKAWVGAGGQHNH